MTTPPNAERKFRLSGADLFLVTALLLLAVFILCYLSSDSLVGWLGNVGSKLHQYALEQGYWGAFLVTFLSNVSVVIVIPYGSVLFLLGSLGLNPWTLGLVTGLAAAAGEVVAYLIGRGTARLLSGRQREKFERLKGFIIRHPRSTPFLIFLFGLTPVPDDIIMIPLGLIGYPFWRAMIPDALGKIALTTLVVYAGRTSSAFFHGLAGEEGGLWVGVVTAVLTILIIYLTIKIKWEELIS